MVTHTGPRGPRRSFTACSAIGAILVLAFAAACDKVPLTAPSGSVITLFAAASNIPLNGEIDHFYVFTATVSPISTTLPLSFTWSYDLGTITDGVIYPNVNGLVQIHTIKWSLTGTYAITVTASNQAGAAVGVYHFTVNRTWRVYLPLVLK